MNPREQGFLLLTSSLGDPRRRPLTDAQLRTLARRVRAMTAVERDRELCAADLVGIGYDRATAERILQLLSQQEQLRWYTSRGQLQDCFPLTRVSPGYPVLLKQRLGDDAPGCLWYKGDLSLLGYPAVALVGSRELQQPNLEFAREVGAQAAKQGFVLISGNARGADRAAQDSCLEHGGRVICVVADALRKCPLQRSVLYLSEDGFDLAFSSQRALHRNRVIHCLGQKVFVAQSGHGKGGTWSGTVYNLQRSHCPVFCYDDGSVASAALIEHGAVPMQLPELKNIPALCSPSLNFIDQ